MSAQLDPIAAQRPRLFGLAYRMLGSSAQAEDTVQEAFARWYAQPRDDVHNAAAFLTTMVTRLCLDHLKSARAQREYYPGQWLPEPIASESSDLYDKDCDDATRGTSIEADLERLQSISLAFITLLDTLTPLERAVYLLHEVFDYNHAEISIIVGRSEAACRQNYRRAKQSLHTRKFTIASPARHHELLNAFLMACQQGDLASITRLLANDVVARADGGGKATAASRPLIGARAVARLYLGYLNCADPPEYDVEIRGINGWPALIVCTDGVLRAVIQIHADDQHINEIITVVNPDKLARLANALAGARGKSGGREDSKTEKNPLSNNYC